MAALVAAVLLFGPAAQARAQVEERGSGFWYGGDGGYAQVELVNCIACDPAGLPFGAVRLGGRIGASMLVGAELGLAGRSAQHPSIASLIGTVTVYPVRRSGAHIRLGLGLLGRGAYSNVDGLAMPALLGGAGYDIRVSEAMSVVPSVSAIIGPGAYATNLVRVGIGLTGH
jgi:hypothetical protein